MALQSPEDLASYPNLSPSAPNLLPGCGRLADTDGRVEGDPVRKDMRV